MGAIQRQKPQKSAKKHLFHVEGLEGMIDGFVMSVQGIQGRLEHKDLTCQTGVFFRQGRNFVFGLLIGAACEY